MSKSNNVRVRTDSIERTCPGSIPRETELARLSDRNRSFNYADTAEHVLIAVVVMAAIDLVSARLRRALI
jgi:hypothetical protein